MSVQRLPQVPESSGVARRARAGGVRSALGRLLFVLAAVSGLGGPALAQPRAQGDTLPELRPSSALLEFTGQPIRRIEVVTEGGRWAESPRVTRVRPGQEFSPALARQAMQELLDSGRYASARAELERAGASGVLLRLVVLPRRVVIGVRLLDSELDQDDVLRAAQVRAGSELTAHELPEIVRRIKAQHAERGFPNARVSVDTFDTDDPMMVLLVIDLDVGAPARVTNLRFQVTPFPALAGVKHSLASYAVDAGDRLDREALVRADRALEGELKRRGFHRARVEHRVVRNEAGAELRIVVRAGPLIELEFEGNRTFDDTQLRLAALPSDSEDRMPATLVERLHAFYLKRGFLDAWIRVSERGTERDPVHVLSFSIREGRPLRVVGREYPCLTGERNPDEVGSEIDSFLSEELPGGDILSPVDPRVVDETFGPSAPRGAQVIPFQPSPWTTYVPEVYERALEHLENLYRSEGYLSVEVGPLELSRRRCDRRSPPGRCLVAGERPRPPASCRSNGGAQARDEMDAFRSANCVADPARSISCEPDAVVYLPIRLGPRATLYDVAFEGNEQLVEADLEELAELDLGGPVSLSALEAARRNILDAYQEEGFAYAEAESELELSPDGTRARVRFVISEREQVRVSRIVVEGARDTSERLIRKRIALKEGELYRRSLARATEEHLATLGVFSSVSVGFEDPYVPAREKTVLVSVVERKPQYLDVRPGFSTGEGFRISFEYGHRNLGGQAIQLTLRSQLGYLPTPLILEADVRRKFDELDVGQRLERRNTATVEFPEIGLGPLFRLSVEGVDVRDNARDFGLTKDAGILSLIYRPLRQFSAQLSGSLELNDARIFGQEERGALQEYVEQNPQRLNTFRVPEGTTLAVAERVSATWDRRDVPLDATEGTLLFASVEHVQANPVGEDARQGSADPNDVFAATKSHFMRYTGRVAGYVRLSQRGLALAASFRMGVIQQLTATSKTYPDRLFFMGGVDSIRGFLQDSLVPEDVAEELLRPGTDLTLREVVIRGGDLFVNPRLELRIPLTGSLQTAFFLDAGNLWTDPARVEPFDLRYAAGSGLRVATPIGPLVFDYGFNVQRILDSIDSSRSMQRFWEDLGAFHFSIGVF